MTRNSLALRLMLGAGVWIVVALVASGVLLATLFQNYVERNFRQTLSTFQQTLVAVSDVSADGVLVITRPLPDPRFEQPLSGWYWQINRGEQVDARSRSLWDQTLRRSSVDGDKQDQIAAGPDGEQLWLAQRDFRIPGVAGSVTVLVGADAATMQADIGSFTRVIVWALGALGILFFTAGFLQIRFGLRPLHRIEATLNAIRSGKSQRLADDFPTEIEPLAHEINSLLDHNAAIIERARTQAGNLAHALKTPLTILRNEADNAGGGLANLVAEQVGGMQLHIDRHLNRARAAGSHGVLGAATPIHASVEGICRAMARLYEDKGLDVSIAVDPELSVACEREDVDEILGDLVDNAHKWARAHVAIRAWREGGVCHLCIEDDGPGIDQKDRSVALDRGKRLDESKPGSGLGLSIVTDIVALYGGSVGLTASPRGGLAALITLPVSPSK